MTQDELFADLKQFIEATVSQQTAHLATKDDLNRIDRKVDGLKGDIRLLDEKLDTIHGAIAETVQDHDRRLGRLEQRAA